MKTTLTLYTFLFFLILPSLGNAQLVLVTGTVLSQNSGKLLQGVNIFESRSGIGTITNLSGFFSLMLKPGNAEIVFSYKGFTELTRTIEVKKDTTLNINMVPVEHLKSDQKEVEHQNTAELVKKGKK